MRLPHILFAAPIAAALALAPGFTPTMRPSSPARPFAATPPLARAADERPVCTQAAPDSGVAVRGGAGGAIHALAVFGDTAYAGIGTRLVVLNLADPSAAKVIGQSPPLRGLVTGLHVAGAYAYVTTREFGLQVVAISDLAAPRVVGEIALEGGALAVTGIGQHILVTGTGWHMVDVADPAQPRRLVTLENRRTLAAVAVSGDNAFFAGEDGTLVTYDIAQPEAPLWQSELRIGGSPRGIAASGRHVFLVGSGLVGDPRSNGMVVVDAVLAEAPKAVATFDMPADAHAIALRRDRAYIVTADAALYVIDVGRPEAPAGLAVLPLAEPSAPLPDTGAVAITVTASRAFVGIGGDLHALDVADAAHPAALGATAVGWPALRVEVRDELAYVAAGRSGLRVVDARDPQAPRTIGAWVEPAGRPVTDLALSGSHLFLASESAGLNVLDITKLTEPGSPSASAAALVGHLDTPAPARVVAVAGSRAYVAVGEAELWTVDVTNPAAPVRRGGITLDPMVSTLTPRISDIAVDGTTVFVATAFSGLYVVDASDAAAPRLWSHSPRGGDRVAHAGDNVLTVREDQDLRVFGMANPAQPRELGRLLDPDWTLRSVVAEGDRAFVAAVPDPRFGVPGPVPGELWTLDIADPLAPRIRDRDPLPAPALALAVAGEQVLAAAGAEGLLVVRPALTQPPRICRVFLPMLGNGEPPPKQLTVRRLWQWVNVNRAADHKDLRVADWDGDGAAELLVADGSYLFSLERGPDDSLHPDWIAQSDGAAWGLDDLGGDGRPDLWTVSESGAVASFAPDLDEPLPFGQIDVGEGMQVRAAMVADLLGNGKRSLVTLISPVPAPPPQPATERWFLRAWGLPDLAPGWRFAIERVDPGLAAGRLLAAQVDGDPAREIAISFPGGRRPGSSFSHGWVIDPALSAAQWLLPEGFGAQVAAADIDGDGREELVGTPVTSTGIVTAAYDADERAEKWRINRSPQPLLLADVTGDDVVEIIAGGTWGAVDIYDAATQLRIREIRSRGLVGGMLGLAVGEIDGKTGADILLALSTADDGPDRLLVFPQADGPERDAVPAHAGPYTSLALRLQGDAGPPAAVIFPEIHATRALSITHIVLDGPTGRDRPGLRLAMAAAGDLPITPAPLEVEIDGDPWPEAVIGLGDRLTVLDHDGRRITDRDFGGPGRSGGSGGAADDAGIAEPRPIWTGDLDSDGLFEVVVAARRRVAVLRLVDLSVVWAIETPESDLPEVLVADIDADGVPEIVLRGRGLDVQAWDGRRRERDWLLPDTAWTADALLAGSVDPDGTTRLAVVADGQVTWYIGTDHAARQGPDLWRGAEHPLLARLLDTPHPQLVAAGVDAVYVYAHPDDAEPALTLPIDAPVHQIGVGDVDGDGRLELLLGAAEGLSAYRVE